MVLDSRRCQVGLRTLELRRDDDEWGQSFTFVVNGVPLFAKGGNWIPADSFPTRLTEARLEHLLSSAAAAHQNMVRVWGGGFYEDERFYDLCDRYGILVWQDFIFSCSVYPLHDPEFLDNLRAEVRDNVRRLRHRACLALWCGNNEMEEGWVHWGWDKPEHQDLKEAFERFFYHTLPAWVAEDDSDHAYWPSSPSSGVPFQNPRGNERGDAHYWEVWHGLKPFTAYRAQLPRFMSEFGFQSLPPFPTIESFAEEPDWNMTSYVMERHQKNAHGNTLIVAQMLDNYRLPKGFRELVYMSMVLQAEGIRYGVEHWRRARARVGGTIYWQLNDCWPVASWASLDYFGRWKALHYAARRFFAPVLLSIEDDGPQMDLFLTSDRVQPWHGQVRWSLETVDGQVLDAAVLPVEAAPLATTPVTALDLSGQVHEDNRRSLIFVAELWEEGRWIAQQMATFVPNKHLELVDPGLAVSLTQPAPDQVQVELRAQTLARFVEVSFDGLDTIFSDNYVDVRTGRPLVLTAPVPAGTTLEQLTQALRVQTLYGAYAQSGG